MLASVLCDVSLAHAEAEVHAEPAGFGASPCEPELLPLADRVEGDSKQSEQRGGFPSMVLRYARCLPRVSVHGIGPI